jgi:oxygen-independent coproporphyrinogen-3 oxidase
VVERLTDAGYRWYETANFCLADGHGVGRDLRAQHNLGIWRGHDYLGIGVGGVSTIGALRRRNLPSLAQYRSALALGREPPRELEPLDGATRACERLMLGLRLDEPLSLAGLEDRVDHDALERLAAQGLVETRPLPGGGREIALTTRGRFLGGAITAELVEWPRDSEASTTQAATSIGGY